jgi:hypothetical protein
LIQIIATSSPIIISRPGQGQALAELDNAPLAGGVRGGVTRPKAGGHAADIDDLATAVLLHVGMDGFRKQERTAATASSAGPLTPSGGHAGVIQHHYT